MPDPLVTLTTDFGEDSPYVAAMKGVLVSINPAVRLLDLGHAVPPQDVRHASWFLAHSVPFFPAGTIHVAVIDPGVGTERRLLCVAVAGQWLLAPDNGCLTGVLQVLGDAPVIRQLTEPRWWRPDVSHTFHGRDILAPVAAHLSRGADPAQLGPIVCDWIRLEERSPRASEQAIEGEVVFVDRFGNLISNIPSAMLPRPPSAVRVGDQEIPHCIRVSTYANAAAGQPVVLVSSDGHVEIAVAEGNAASRFGAVIGTPITLQLGERQGIIYR